MIIIKECSICKQVKEISGYYPQKKKKSNGEEYLYYPPYCKECTKDKAWKWQLDNYEQHKERMRDYNKTKDWKIKLNRENGKRRRLSGQHKEWQKNNPDKIRLYGELHRNHDITDQEWLMCKEYFNNECAYCGLHISEHFIKYAGELKHTDFHKEHVYHDGANDISNCVPSCKSCNSQKWIIPLEEWYSETNEKYTVERLHKINKWLNEDCFNIRK